MAFLGIGKKKKIIDLTERYKKEPETKKTKENSPVNEISPFGINFQPPEETENYSEEDKRKKLARRLMDMTTKIEELSNTIYRLQQRIEVLEKKSGVGNS